MTITATAGWVDAILGLVVIEFIAIGLLLVRASAGHLVATLFLYLASGACLLAGLRAALASAGVHWIPLLLLASGLAHAASLWKLHGLVLGPTDGRRGLGQSLDGGAH